MTTKAYARVFEVLALGGLLAGAGCAGVKQVSSTGQGGSSASGSGGSLGRGGSTGAGGSVIKPTGCNGLCTDFEPTADNPNPIFQEGVSTSVAGMFGTPSGSPPCVTEPEDGSLFPNNWLAPRVHVPNNTGYLKITFHADMESTDLVAYAQGDSWALPKPLWMALAQHIVSQPVTVTVQTPGGGAATSTFTIAPVGAGGSMVFWSADPKAVGKDLSQTTMYPESSIVNDSYLDGFTVGDASTIAQANGRPVLQITDVVQPTVDNNGNTRTAPRCIGCHVGTPDGDYVAFNDFWPWSVAFADVSPNNGAAVGSILPSYGGATCTNWNTCTPTCAQGSVCTNGKIYAQEPWGGPVAFSPAHWNISGTGERIALMTTQLPDPSMPWSQNDKDPAKLIWMDTNMASYTMINGVPVPQQGVAWDYVAHTGDLGGGVAFPTWSNNGENIVYSSSAGTTADQDGRLNVGMTDLYTVPYNAKAGGAAMPVPGASSASLEEYYPAFAPDDSMLAYTAVPAGQVMYANEQAELYVVPYGNGGTAIRLNANDPPKCSGQVSPGINNHWPKWSPTVSNDSNGNTYYWIIFSSNRYNPAAMTVTNGSNTSTVWVSQLYITAVVKTETTYVTYPAIYLYNQPSNRLNTTPAWQDFNIPIIVN
ncbi:MAG TPA: hypothetical protein VHO06_23320 [Polyangia bacterium]|nr:hypothetical protein [Polyangia bacterium]